MKGAWKFVSNRQRRCSNLMADSGIPKKNCQQPVFGVQTTAYDCKKVVVEEFGPSRWKGFRRLDQRVCLE